MSEYRRQIALGGVVAVVLAAALGFGVVYYFPSGAAQSTITQSTAQVSSVTSTETSTATTTAVSTTTAITTETSVSTATTTATATSTSTSTVSSATTTSISTTTAATSTVTSTVTSTASTTTTCVPCSRLAIISANLTVNPSTNRAILSVAVKNGGSDNASNLTIVLGSTEILVIPELDAGQQTWVSIQIPSQVGIQTSESYQITVSAQFGASVIETSTGVTATQG